MSRCNQELVRYWRRSLIAGEESRKIKGVVLRDVPFGRLMGLTIPQETISLLKEDVPEQERKAFTDGKESLRVMIAPVVLECGRGINSPNNLPKRKVVVFWVEAELNSAGTLTPLSAFVDRGVMSPFGDGIEPHQTFVTLSAVDEEGPLEAEKHENWADFTVRLRAWFDRLFRAPLEQWKQEGMSRRSMIACASGTSIPAMSILAFYEHFENMAKIPALLRSLCGGRQNPARTTVPLPESCAQMGAEYPLNPGQRKALAATLALEPGELLAVNGPPGTGKTTLLQSVIGSLWVASAAKEDNCPPPLILASSTNNQAITNILASLAGAAIPGDHPLNKNGLAERWIPDLSHYGLYLPSKSEAGKIEEKIWGQRGNLTDPQDVIAYPAGTKESWNGLPWKLEKEDYVRRAAGFYRRKAALWSGEELDTLQAVHRLKRTISGRLEQIRHVEELWRRLHEADPFLRTASTFEAYQQSITVQLEQNQVRLEDLRQSGLAAVSEYHGLIGLLLGWLPAVRRAAWTRAQRHLADRKLADAAWDWKTVLKEHHLRGWLSKEEEALRREIGKGQDLLALCGQWSNEIHALFPGLRPDEQVFSFLLNEDRFQEALDIGPRAELFHLAGRYWEGRWLIEIEKVLQEAKTNPKVLGGKNRRNCQARWHRYAMLTPCLVATAYTAPKRFSYFDAADVPLLEFIDLLIIDEAGQVSPAVGSALFGLAKRALVVGDIQQLEPVWEVDKQIDSGNLRQQGLAAGSQDLELLDQQGLRSSSGSIMKMARHATAFSETRDSNGFLLRDHWRCHPDVISFCNALAYNGELIPKRKRADKDTWPLPRLGYAHVQGLCQTTEGSRFNPDEARALASWLKRHRGELLSGHFSTGKENLKLGDVVAIITPFTLQAREIRKALRDRDLEPDFQLSPEEAESITIGTVHSLQGAERQVILFSPVYDTDSNPPQLFFDRGVNMLNVAVSRAKESFLVFGNMALFKNNGTRLPSSILAGYLFADHANEITDIDPVLAIQDKHEEVRRIDTLEGHRELLRQAIQSARRKLLIVSPYLTSRALKADKLVPLLSKSLSKGEVKITIAYDLKQNKRADNPEAVEALALLGGIPGLDIRPCEDIHNKTLVVDDDWIVEGSFNWLSAVRDPMRPYSRHEVSLVYAGRQVPDFSARAWKQAGGMTEG